MSSSPLNRSLRVNLLSLAEPPPQKMSCGKAISTTIGSTLFCSGLGAAVYAGCGALGAALLKATSVNDYDPHVAGTLGALGGSLLLAPVGFVHGLTMANGRTSELSKKMIGFVVAGGLASGPLGCAIMSINSTAGMAILPVVASFAAGTAVVTAAVACCVKTCRGVYCNDE